MLLGRFATYKQTVWLCVWLQSRCVTASCGTCVWLCVWLQSRCVTASCGTCVWLCVWLQSRCVTACCGTCVWLCVWLQSRCVHVAVVQWLCPQCITVSSFFHRVWMCCESSLCIRLWSQWLWLQCVTVCLTIAIMVIVMISPCVCQWPLCVTLRYAPTCHMCPTMPVMPHRVTMCVMHMTHIITMLYLCLVSANCHAHVPLWPCPQCATLCMVKTMSPCAVLHPSLPKTMASARMTCVQRGATLYMVKTMSFCLYFIPPYQRQRRVRRWLVYRGVPHCIKLWSRQCPFVLYFIPPYQRQRRVHRWLVYRGVPHCIWSRQCPFVCAVLRPSLPKTKASAKMTCVQRGATLYMVKTMSLCLWCIFLSLPKTMASVRMTSVQTEGSYSHHCCHYHCLCCTLAFITKVQAWLVYRQRGLMAWTMPHCLCGNLTCYHTQWQVQRWLAHRWRSLTIITVSHGLCYIMILNTWNHCKLQRFYVCGNIVLLSSPKTDG